MVDLLIAQHPGDIGEIAVRTARRVPPHRRWRRTRKRSCTGYTVVTRDNIDDPEIARYLYFADCDDYVLANPTPTAAEPAGGAEATPSY